MLRPFLSDILYVPIEDPPAAVPVDVLVPAPVIAATVPPDAPAEPVAVAVPEADPAPPAADAAAPAFALPPEDAFPTLAELDAILAANAGPPPGPTAAERAEVIALLGLDPATAADPDLYAALIAGLPAPDANEVLAQWLNDVEAEAPPWEWDAAQGDWQIG